MITQFFRRHSAVIPDSLAGKRLDQALAAMFEDYSRTNIKSWIEQGRVRVNMRVCRPRDRVSTGDEIELTATFTTRDGPRPQVVDYGVVYSDPDVLVIDKPPGLVVHPGAGNPENTLVNGLLHEFPELDLLPRAGLIHRLDKNTSGLLIVARTPRSYQFLIQQMSDRRIKRVYEAVVNGCMISGGKVDAAIGRDRKHRTRMAIRAEGRPAVTHHRVLRRFRAHTHIEVELETGRTHQIRVHMAHLGFPVVGDVRYGARPVLPPEPEPDLKATLGGFRRHALHAKRLSFTHPSSGCEAGFEAPLPGDMRALLDALEEDADRKGASPHVS
jgi:23S rRNA pseudouridine1911/1915/1917 synthase